jgi:putative endonuclease
MSGTSKKAGDAGEEIAVSYLIKNGYTIIERNFRFGHGEIDIIAKKNGVLIFIEVKTRRSLEFGEPEYAVTMPKQNQIRKIASAYLYEKEIKDQDCRLDVIAILFEKNNKYTLNHIENAF